jgi:hypothetical protein
METPEQVVLYLIPKMRGQKFTDSSMILIEYVQKSKKECPMQRN